MASSTSAPPSSATRSSPTRTYTNMTIPAKQSSTMIVSTRPQQHVRHEQLPPATAPTSRAAGARQQPSRRLFMSDKTTVGHDVERRTAQVFIYNTTGAPASPPTTRPESSGVPQPSFFSGKRARDRRQQHAGRRSARRLRRRHGQHHNLGLAGLRRTSRSSSWRHRVPARRPRGGQDLGPRRSSSTTTAAASRPTANDEGAVHGHRRRRLGEDKRVGAHAPDL